MYLMLTTLCYLLLQQPASAQVGFLLESVQKTLTGPKPLICETEMHPDVDIETLCPGFSQLITSTKRRKNELSISDPFMTKSSEEFANLYRTLYSSFDHCQQIISDQCHQGLKAIQKNKLFEEFVVWTNNPLYRMKSPDVQCYKRASLLSQELIRKKVRTSLMYIDQTPMGMAVVLDKDGKPKNEYMDYGTHWVVVVEDENKQKYILDPQFRNTPQKYESYFLSYAGKGCQEKKDANSYSRWDCTYRLYPPTYIFPESDKTIETFSQSPQCFPNLESTVRELEAINKQTFSGSEKRPPSLSEIEFIEHVKNKASRRVCIELSIASVQIGLKPHQKDQIDADLRRCQKSTEHKVQE